jgi:cell wall-associated NlpC family hydrolase
MKVLDCEDKYLGVPYKYGSDRNTDKDFDCSDLQAWGFEKGAGIDIHAQSTAQWEHDGVHVAKSDLRPGDLVFFDTNRDGIVNHVGIIAAPGLMLHTASAKYGVCYVPFGPGEYYYDTAYVGGKRIIN